MRMLSKLFVILTAFMLFAACLMKSPTNNTSPQGWWAERGTVVPHDSFPADCSICHTGDDWRSIREDFEFDHLAETGTPLEGAHKSAECLRCHNDRGPVQAFAQRGCAGCHDDVHRGQLGSDCSLCHDEDDWQPNEQISLHNRTRFPLAGAHAAVACWRCHEGARVGNFSRVDTQCISCHASDLADAVNPDHLALGWVDSCERCHVPTSWSSTGFSHETFPLTGAHRSLDCQRCHVGNVFTGLSSDCASCHLNDYNGTTDPNHVAENFPMACEQCHNTSTWEGARFTHMGITNGCVDCHLDDYTGATDPEHAAANFPMNCEQCHSTNTWQGAAFNHTGITTGCVDCHLADYNGANDPDHAGGGFSTNCEDCHSTNTWQGAGFNHAGIMTGCVDCHLADFNGASDPNHNSAGFPMDCELCHTTRDWDGANFNHPPPFIITNSDHNRSCNECHMNPSNFAEFTCTQCHAHTQSESLDDHDNGQINGYVWESNACFMCHPNGRED